MIPILYDKYETAFTFNGLGRLADCISCTVTEERNGIYECQFTYPVTGEMFPEIQEGRIIAVIHDDAKDIQPFDIYAHSTPLNGVVTFYAHHISYRLGSVILKPMEASSCVSALAAIPNNTYNRCPFTFWTDKAVSAQWENKVPSAVKAILGGQQGSILDVYGKGEYQWDKWLVRLYVNRGNDNGVSIRYGVNLTDLKQDYDESGSYNAVAPYWVNSENGTVVTLTKGIVAVNAGTRLVPWTTQSGEEITDRAGNTIYFKISNPITPVPMDLSEAFETQPTEAQLEAEALRRLNSSEAWLPSENITVKFVNLADTEEYKNVAALQRVSLCDRVSVYCGPLNVSAVKMQVIRVVYNVLTERYNEMELGKAKTSFAQTITAQVEEMTKDMPTMSMMQQAISNATDRITGAMGGHVRFIYDTNGEMQEILIMDTDDINTAVNVWRWNSGGFGFSSNGYAGPYGTAMTMDGAIVADFITSGTLNANLITSGGISGTKIANGAISTDKLAANAVTAVKIAANAVTADKIAANAVTAAKIAADAISANMINAGTMLAERIKGGTLTLGGQNNTNGVLRINDSSGNKIGGWDNSGIQLSKGNISFPKDGQISCNFSSDGQSYIKLSGDYQSSSEYEKAYGMRLKVQNATAELTAYSETNETTEELDLNVSDYIPQFLMNGGGFFTDDCSLLLSPVAIRLVQNRGTLLDIHVEEFNPDTASTELAYMKWNAGFECNSLYCRNTKSRIVSTDQYSDRLLYCYETSTPIFGDIGDGVISEDGLCYVMLDAIFAQTISTNQYQVFLQKYSSGDCWVRERKGAYFIVEGTPGLQFGWEVKAKQRDYDQLRLDRNDEKFTVPTQTYGENAAKHIDDIRKEREAA